MTDLPALKAEMFERYGKPRRLSREEYDTGDVDIMAFAHATQEAAEAFAEVDREHYGHLATVEHHDGLGWLCLLDIRPAVEAAKAERAAEVAEERRQQAAEIRARYEANQT